MTRAEGVRVAHPLFHAGGDGSQPISALQLFVHRVMPAKAKELNQLWHSRLPRIGDPLSTLYAGLHFVATFNDVYYAVAMWTHPVSRSLPQTEWLELRRLAVAPDAPRNTASRMLAVMARLIRQERPKVTRLMSYQDTDAHTGGIYRAAGWTATARSKSGTWNQPNSRNTNGCKRTRPADQSTAEKQRWERVL